MEFSLYGKYRSGDAWFISSHVFLSSSQRDHQRKMNLSGTTAGRSTHLASHLEEETPCPDRDLVAGVAILYIPHPAPWALPEATEVQVPTKTSNSPFSTRLLLFLFPFFCSGLFTQIIKIISLTYHS